MQVNDTFHLMTTTSSPVGQNSPKFVVAEPNTSDTAKAAVAVSQAILEADWAKLDSLLDHNFTYTGDGATYTKDQYIGFMQDMRAAFSDFEMILEKLVVDNDFVSIRFSSKVVNTGSFMGSPANRKHITVTGIFMRKVANGKVMQEWQTTDILGIMSQIGFGATFGYAVFVSGFKLKPKPPVRKPDDFLHLKGSVENYDHLPAKEKNKYVKQYLKTLGTKK